MSNTGYKTKGKEALIALLEEHSQTTMSADTIHELLTQQGINLNLTTIYRNLDKLAETHKILKFPASDGHKAYYQIMKRSCCNHLHLQCSHCGKVIHLDCKYMSDFANHISNEHGFDLTFDHSILFGLCSDCKNLLQEEKKKK